MMRYAPGWMFIVLSASLAACNASRAARPAEPPPALQDFPYDSSLFAVLASPPGTPQLDALRALEARTGLQLNDTLASILEDSVVHPLLRANAVWLLGQQRSLAHLILLQPLLADPDERVRLATVAAAREFLGVTPGSAMNILSEALQDSSMAVQARVLEAITDRDVALLRSWLRSRPPPQLIPIGRDLIAAAESRGAQLVPDSSTHELSRAVEAGHTLRFRPVQQWRQWHIAVGRLELQTARGSTHILGERIEVVRDVMPAFFSSDGAVLVYEKEREILVREIATGRERSAGAGTAPRPVPFTDGFVFTREITHSRKEEGPSTTLTYELVRDTFTAAADARPAEVIGALHATVSFDVAGGASPVRWMRVRENAGATGFELAGAGIETFALPALFGPAREPR